MIGIFFFLTSSTIVRSAGLPMTDVAFLFFFMLAMVAMLKENVWLFLAATTIGVLAKELILLLLPLILLIKKPKILVAELLLATVPAIAIYFILHGFMPNTTPDGAITSGLSMSHIVESLRQFSRLNGWINLFWSFGLAWFPGLYALFVKELPVILKRWSLLVPVVFIGVLAGLGNINRSMFTAAPVFIPLAAFGADAFIRKLRDSGKQEVAV